MAHTVRFIGSGDAFGSGGRLQTCILIDSDRYRIAVDFGTTSLVGLKQQGIDHNSIDAILLTHLHGDHCGGVPFLIMDAMLGAKREHPLVIAGPEQTQSHLSNLQEALFPGSHVMVPKFPLRYEEIIPNKVTRFLGLKISAVAARHTKQTNPLALRIETEEKSIVYTGDGEYTDALAELVNGADLLIAECYFYSRPIKWHLNYPDITKLHAKKTILTHMHSDMLEMADQVPETCAHDGLALEF